MEEDERQEALATASAVVDTLRHLFSVLGALLASEAGHAAAQDAAEARSLPALGKALRRLWFGTPIGGDSWDSKEQAVWLCRVLVLTEGSRAGLLSFYGAGLLCVDALATFAEVVLGEAKVPVDEAWATEAMAVQEALRGRHWEHLQQWPADKRCGGGAAAPLLSADRLPKTMRRVFDLEGVRLTKAQAAGLGVAMFMPGSMTLAMGSVGAALLVKKVQEERSLAAVGGLTGSSGDAARWHAVQARCLDHAHELLRRKTCPIEVRYAPGFNVPSQIKVTLYGIGDPLCALPVGSLAGGLGGGTGGESTARLRPGDRCALRPAGGADGFRMRVYKPAPLLDVVLHDGVEVKRGDRLVLVAAPGGGQVRCFAEQPRAAPAAGTGETDVAPPAAAGPEASGQGGGSGSTAEEAPPGAPEDDGGGDGAADACS